MTPTMKIEHSGVNFSNLADQQLAQLDVVVRKSALGLEANAKTLAAVDTGTMRNSIYTTTRKSSTYARAAANSRKSFGAAGKKGLGRNRGRDVKLFDEARVSEKFEANVGVAVEYGGYVEYGSSRTPAQPFMGPATEKIAPVFLAACEKALR